MMRKIAVLLFAVVVAIAVCGCSGSAARSANGKEISGSPTSVVEQCQEITAGENVTITVVGRVQKGQNSDTVLMMRDDNDGVSSVVNIVSKDPIDDEKIKGRVTFKGKLDTRNITGTIITITDAELVE